MSKKIIVFGLLAAFLMTSGFGCKLTDKQTKEAMKPITLTYWRVFDGPDAFDEVIAKYKALHPFVSIEYKKLRYSEYETELLNALAEDRGPDIFSIHNTWMRKYQSKLAPLPETITMVYPVEKGTIKKEVIPEARTTRSLSIQQLKDSFVDVVSGDVVIENKIWGLPLSIDTLALYYNKDLFNNAGISQAPQFWNKEFLQDVKKLTKQDAKKGLIQAGAALGGSTNINRYSDILAVLMLQSGATMMTPEGQVMFHTAPTTGGYVPGTDALRFYADFADPVKEAYTWNAEQPNSLDMFISGNLGMMFSYSYDLPTIKALAPKLNFSVAKLPQIEGTPPTNVNFANYWVETVSKKSPNIEAAWDFIQFITAAEQAQAYLEKTKHPTALRALVAKQKEDPEIAVFVDQVLTAKSWYKGKDVRSAEAAIAEMIDNANKNREKLQEVVSSGAAKVQQTVY